MGAEQQRWYTTFYVKKRRGLSRYVHIYNYLHKETAKTNKTLTKMVIY